MFPPSEANVPQQPAPAQPAASRRWHPALAVPAVVLATLVVPPLGAALAFMARWDKAGRAVTVVVASIWFAVLVAAPGPKARQADAEHGPQPTTTVTVTATPPQPAPSGPTSPAPSQPAASEHGPVTASTTPPAPAVAAPLPPPVPQDPPARPRSVAPDDGKARTSGDGGTGGGPVSGGSSHTGGGGSVFYRNCTAVREADAAPIRRGDPGYGPHLDRDGDGVACE